MINLTDFSLNRLCQIASIAAELNKQISLQYKNSTTEVKEQIKQSIHNNETTILDQIIHKTKELGEKPTNTC